jgi:hypothetical protein
MEGHVLRELAAVFVVLGTSTAALAGPCDDGVPPVQFRKAPTVPYVVKLVDETGIFSRCQTSPTHPQGTMILWGCAKQVSATSFAIYINKDTTASEQACILAHEKAHLPPNYWSPMHGNKTKRAKWQVDAAYRGPNPIH